VRFHFSIQTISPKASPQELNHLFLTCSLTAYWKQSDSNTCVEYKLHSLQVSLFNREFTILLNERVFQKVDDHPGTPTEPLLPDLGLQDNLIASVKLLDHLGKLMNYNNVRNGRLSRLNFDKFFHDDLFPPSKIIPFIKFHCYLLSIVQLFLVFSE